MYLVLLMSSLWKLCRDITRPAVFFIVPNLIHVFATICLIVVLPAHVVENRSYPAALHQSLDRLKRKTVHLHHKRIPLAAVYFVH